MEESKQKLIVAGIVQMGPKCTAAPADGEKHNAVLEVALVDILA